MPWMVDCWMAGNCGFKWRDMDVQHLLIEAAEVVVVEDHAVGAEIVGVPDPDPAADRAAVTGIADALTAAVAAVLALIAKALVESHARAASPRTGKRTVVPNQGTELVEKGCARG